MGNKENKKYIWKGLGGWEGEGGDGNYFQTRGNKAVLT